ncbi:MAG TPA: 1-(5-phosphoribosyl)-5-[(5-phosphoribosylamino)methylideneamino]imidazole-4-carboxamide isomerase [Acidimicrobiia bacterium]|nr:1-(5-phosphoribosyl)-5-[(5-phosphoribosylamino)methylideneamino]imidazole-4-carboxamide isomerase [Acidimicrobiia bacterium]
MNGPEPVGGFQLFPAIDLLGGRVVRLRQGDYDAETVYADDPVAVAARFADAGAPWIHVVDLDAARDGTARNLDALEAIGAAVATPIQAGGGVRSVRDAQARLAHGVARVVVGSAAVEHPEVVDELAASHPGAVAVGLDARGRDVAIHGWRDATGRDLVDLARRFDRPGVGALVVTDIARDGMLEGPATEQLRAVVGEVGVPVVASGGVGGLDDLRVLRDLEVDGRALAGVIVGRALYEGRFTVEEAVAACSRRG